MTIPSVATARPDRIIRPPGIYIEDRLRAGAGESALMTGVPAFVGFARPADDVLERHGGPVVVLDRWDARTFDRSIVPEPVDEGRTSFMRTAVRGFFANGGKRCVVLAVPPEQGAKGLANALQNGPLPDRSDVDLICIPDAVSPRIRKGGALFEIQAAALAHCEATGDRFAILDAPEDNPEGADDPVDRMLGMTSMLRSAFGALYFPWIAVDPASGGATSAAGGRVEWRCPRWPERDDETRAIEYVPPCGHVAGLIARIDALVGPQRSPANVILEDAVDTAVHLTAAQHALLNQGGVNCLRSLRGQGVEISGARTLSGHSAWAHVSTARVILGFRRWLAVGMSDLVFEPQTTTLWDRIRIRLVSQCLELYRTGALAGTDASQAFFVQCDGETNPPNERDLGRVVAHVGLAPSVPAEFIVVRIVCDADRFTVGELP